MVKTEKHYSVFSARPRGVYFRPHRAVSPTHGLWFRANPISHHSNRRPWFNSPVARFAAAVPKLRVGARIAGRLAAGAIWGGVHGQRCC